MVRLVAGACIVVLGGCRAVFGLDSPALAVDAATDIAAGRSEITVSTGSGAPSTHDLADGPLLLDFATSCADSTYTLVPQRTLSVIVKIWGAGGGAAGAGGNNGAIDGGGGGYATTELELVEGQSYVAVLGQGGGCTSMFAGATCGGGGATGSGLVNTGAGEGGTGGGFGGLFETSVEQSRAILIAGGGGGAGGDPSAGGAGGGQSGGPGIAIGGGDSTRDGTGGSQTDGGAPGAKQTASMAGRPGTALVGGNSSYHSDGGGGGGYFGGGSGGSSNGGAGGGGSGYCSSSSTMNLCTFMDAPVSGTAGAPANAADTDRGTAGAGTNSFTQRAGNARIVLRLSPT